MKQSKELRTFVRNECSFYDQSSGTCQFTDIEHCKVMDGQRCNYFERSVLAPADWKSRMPGYLPGYDHQKLLAQYDDIGGLE